MLDGAKKIRAGRASYAQAPLGATHRGRPAAGGLPYLDVTARVNIVDVTVNRNFCRKRADARECDTRHPSRLTTDP